MSVDEAAYYMWLEAGCPEGRDVEFWLAAEEQELCAIGKKCRRKTKVKVTEIDKTDYKSLLGLSARDYDLALAEETSKYGFKDDGETVGFGMSKSEY